MKVSFRHTFEGVIKRWNDRRDGYCVDGLKIQTSQLKQVTGMDPIFIHRSRTIRSQAPMGDQFLVTIDPERGISVSGINYEKHIMNLGYPLSHDLPETVRLDYQPRPHLSLFADAHLPSGPFPHTAVVSKEVQALSQPCWQSTHSFAAFGWYPT